MLLFVFFSILMNVNATATYHQQAFKYKSNVLLYASYYLFSIMIANIIIIKAKDIKLSDKKSKILLASNIISFIVFLNLNYLIQSLSIIQKFQTMRKIKHLDSDVFAQNLQNQMLDSAEFAINFKNHINAIKSNNISQNPSTWLLTRSKDFINLQALKNINSIFTYHVIEGKKYKEFSEKTLDCFYYDLLSDNDLSILIFNDLEFFNAEYLKIICNLMENGKAQINNKNIKLNNKLIFLNTRLKYKKLEKIMKKYDLDILSVTDKVFNLKLTHKMTESHMQVIFADLISEIYKNYKIYIDFKKFDQLSGKNKSIIIWKRNISSQITKKAIELKKNGKLIDNDSYHVITEIKDEKNIVKLCKVE